MSERPTSVNIFSTRWNIVWQPTMVGHNVFGETTDYNVTITIDDRMTPEQERTTLLHELAHAILFTITDIEEVGQHGVIYAISQGFWDIANRNPALWSWLFADPYRGIASSASGGEASTSSQVGRLPHISWH